VETERSGWAKGDRKDFLPGETPPPRPGQAARAETTRPPGTMGIGGEGSDGTQDAPGAILREVVEGGAAAQAGLIAGDRVTKVGDTEIRSYSDLTAAARGSRAGDKVAVVFVRGEEEKTVELTFGSRQGGGGGGGRPN